MDRIAERVGGLLVSTTQLRWGVRHGPGPWPSLTAGEVAVIKTIKLMHFKGFRSLELDLAPVSVIIGSNASGKSTFLQSVAMVMGAVDIAVRTPAASNQVLISGAEVNGLTAGVGGWQALFTRGNDFLADHLAVEASFDGALVRHASVLATMEGDANPIAQVRAELTAAEARLPATSAHPSASVIAHVGPIARSEAYVPDVELDHASRTSGAGALLRNRLIRLGEQAIERINRTLWPASGAEITSRTPHADATVGTPLAVRFRRDGNTFELEAANQGLVSLLAFLSDVEAQLASSADSGERQLLLDEPELHLHPSAQERVAEHLAALPRAVGAQIISVTHSEHLARRLSARRDSALFNIERRFTRVRRLYTQRDLVRALGQTRDLSLYSPINFLTTKRVLFVEGDADECIIRQCALAHLGASPDLFRRFEAWTCVQLDGVGNAPAPELIERLVSSGLLPKLADRDLLLVVSVLDRDYDKDPGSQTHRGAQVQHTKLVWGRHSIESLFIEAGTLAALLSTALGEGAPHDLTDRIRCAIATADANDELRDGATDELAEVFRRSQRFQGKAANAEARRLVRTHPEVWQRGKDRADFVLKHVRATLPLGLQNEVRASIDGLLKAIPPDELRRIVVPTEIVQLIDNLVDSAPPSE